MKLSEIIQQQVDEAVKRGYNCKQFVEYSKLETQRRQHINGERFEFDFDTACEIDISKLPYPCDGCDGCYIEQTCADKRRNYI